MDQKKSGGSRKIGRSIRKHGRYTGPGKKRADTRKGNYPVRTLIRGTRQRYELKYRDIRPSGSKSIFPWH